MGEPEWAFPRARHFAERGLVAIAAEYRLSTQKDVTPIEAMADARAVIRWMRAKADSLGIDPEKIAAYGWSAGGHLAASAAIFTDDAPPETQSAAPNALVLVSPAISLGRTAGSNALGAGALRDISRQVTGDYPDLILRSDDRDGIRRGKAVPQTASGRGNTCELHVYKGSVTVHEKEPDDGMPNRI
jgi:acetyl esterase/lipase